MAKNTSISLGSYFEEIIQNCINSGRYTSVSEVVREGLRLVDEQEKRNQLLRDAIEAGEKSGYVQDFDPVKHLAELKGKYSK